MYKKILTTLVAILFCSFCFVSNSVLAKEISNKVLATEIHNDLSQYPDYSKGKLKNDLYSSLNPSFINDVCNAQPAHKEDCLSTVYGYQIETMGAINILNEKADRRDQEPYKYMLNEDVGEITFFINVYLTKN